MTITATRTTKPESVKNADGTTTSAYTCSFCLEGRHAKCYRALVNGNKGVYLCPCAEPNCGGKILSCIDCKKVHDDVRPDTRQCIDRDGCNSRILARRQNDPIYQMVVQIQEKQAMAKEENKTPRAAAKPKTGVCKCGCEGTTKGGNFLPGHDARYVSEQVGFVLTKAKTEAVARKDIGAISEALQAKFDKSLGLARAKADKQAQAEKDRKAAAKVKADEAAKAKADKAKASAKS